MARASRGVGSIDTVEERNGFVSVDEEATIVYD